MVASLRRKSRSCALTSALSAPTSPSASANARVLSSAAAANLSSMSFCSLPTSHSPDSCAVAMANGPSQRQQGAYLHLTTASDSESAYPLSLLTAANSLQNGQQTPKGEMRSWPHSVIHLAHALCPQQLSNVALTLGACWHIEHERRVAAPGWTKRVSSKPASAAENDVPRAHREGLGWWRQMQTRWLGFKWLSWY